MLRLDGAREISNARLDINCAAKKDKVLPACGMRVQRICMIHVYTCRTNAKFTNCPSRVRENPIIGTVVKLFQTLGTLMHKSRPDHCVAHLQDPSVHLSYKW